MVLGLILMPGIAYMPLNMLLVGLHVGNNDCAAIVRGPQFGKFWF